MTRKRIIYRGLAPQCTIKTIKVVEVKEGTKRN